MTVYVKKAPHTSIDPLLPRKASGQEKSHLSYTSDSYQKILDYHVVEIFLTTVVFGIIVLLRLHR
jgi:hypothetical protein